MDLDSGKVAGRWSAANTAGLFSSWHHYLSLSRNCLNNVKHNILWQVVVVLVTQFYTEPRETNKQKTQQLYLYMVINSSFVFVLIPFYRKAETAERQHPLFQRELKFLKLWFPGRLADTSPVSPQLTLGGCWHNLVHWWCWFVICYWAISTNKMFSFLFYSSFFNL